MNITPQEAKESLSSIHLMTQRTRRAINAGGSANYMLIWGAVWFIGFLGIHFFGGAYPGLVGAAWAVLDIAAVIACARVSARSGRQIRDPFSTRLAFFWLALIFFGLLWLWLARPANMAQGSLLVITFAMFGYVVMGIWLEKVFIAVGIGVVVLAVGSYLLLPEFFALWMAILGGGTLIGSGVYILRRW